MLFLLSIVISTNKTEAAVQDTNEGTSNVQWEDENFGESICNALKKEEVTYADIEGITGISIDSQYVVKLIGKIRQKNTFTIQGMICVKYLHCRNFLH